MSLQEIFSNSKDSSTDCTFETTVGSGFEKLAEKEVKRKLGNDIQVCPARGRVFFNTDINKYSKVTELRSVNNISLIGATFLDIPFSNENKEDDAEQIKDLVNRIDWTKCLKAWADIMSCGREFYPTLEQYEEAVKRKKRSQRSKKKIKLEQKADEVPLEDDESTKLLSDEEIEKLPEPSSTGKPDYLNVLAFRVTCYRTGKHSFQSQEAAEYFGGALQDKFHWIVDLVNYDLEIVLNVASKSVYVALNLTQESLHRRNIYFFGPTTLQSTTCFNMLQIANPVPGEIVIDPLCGGGSIPIEGCFGFPSSFYLSGDLSDKAVVRTKNNLQCLYRKKNIPGFPVDVNQWDCTRLPLRDSIVDVFITDLPFGKRMGNKFLNRGLYKKSLIELARVIVPKTGRAVLLTHDKSAMARAIPASKGYWNQAQKLSVNIGGLKAAVYHLNRTGKEFEGNLKNA
ncbi:tRNA (guanine(6)-N(2))-methyltransferase THUMP3 isoform X2 [Bemisia tabaci]|uniref:tRNA (guanine(6)-N(2))-methyltransferase THUMP3 isoform X2 n=1 Tax=Bemisia tabaci TaxID=7038 RepID=UPI003B27E389